MGKLSTKQEFKTGKRINMLKNVKLSDLWIRGVTFQQQATDAFHVRLPAH